MSRTRYRVAAVQAAPVYLNKTATTEKSVALIEKAAKQGTALIAFGEAWLPGYPFWVWLDGAFANFGRFRAYAEASVEIDGPEIKAIRAVAARAGALRGSVGISGWVKKIC